MNLIESEKLTEGVGNDNYDEKDDVDNYDDVDDGDDDDDEGVDEDVDVKKIIRAIQEYGY